MAHYKLSQFGAVFNFSVVNLDSKEPNAYEPTKHKCPSDSVVGKGACGWVCNDPTCAFHHLAWSHFISV